MDKKFPIIVSNDKQFVISAKDFEFAYIRNIFESSIQYQVVVVIKGCHDVEPHKEGLVISSHDNEEDAKKAMMKLVRTITDITGLECVEM